MSVLGEAFIAVRADMSPFRRELRTETQAAADQFEKDLGAGVEKGLKDGAAKGADSVADEVVSKIRTKTRSELGSKHSNPWIVVAGALGGALDDGISALPAEVKAALVAGIIAALPIVSAALTGAIGAAVAAGVAIFGIALASQFESVQTRWALFATNVRNSLVTAAHAFQEVTIGVLDTVEQQILDWDPLFRRIFDQGAKFVLPLVNGILDGIQFILDSIDAGLENGADFVTALADSFAILGAAVGDAIEIIMSTGDLGADAFRDFVYLVGLLIVGSAELLKIFTGLYTFIRRIVDGVPDLLLATQPYLLLLKGIVRGSDEAKNSTLAYAYTNVQFVEGMGDVVTLTKDEEKALKELEKAIEDARDAAFDSIQTNIDWERSIDELDEAFKKNGNTISAETEKGRRNLEQLGEAIRAAQKLAEERYARGEINAQQARDLYRAEVDEIYRVASAYGVTRAQVDSVFGKVIDLLNLPAPNVQWAADLAYYAGISSRELEKAARAAWNLNLNRPGGPQPFADGGVVYQPTQALIGEAGIEAVIPLTKPARAAQLMRQTGLDKMVSGGGDTTVYVYLGNEAFDQHVQKIVVQDSRVQARQLTYGVRP